MKATRHLILVRGLPGSGKTTLARKIATIHCEADHYFEKEDGTYCFDPSKLKEAHAECLARATGALEAFYLTVVSNTFTTHKEMEPYFEMAKRLGAEVHVLTCKGNYGSVHNVPESVISAMKARWEE